MNLFIKELPAVILIDGEPYGIHTDFRVWMRFCDAFEKWDQAADLDIGFVFTDRIPALRTPEDMRAVLDFAYPPAELPKSSGEGGGRILDYRIDADYIFSAFLSQYGIDLTETDLHWHKFYALMRGISKGTRLHEIMGYRSYDGQEKEYIRLRNLWELPLIQTAAEKKKSEEFDEYFD